MKKTLGVLLVCILLVVTTATSQNKASIAFDRMQYDFGKIREVDGVKSTIFNFTNNGNDTLKILTVKPGCGCTVADWTQTPVLPGSKGYVKATYDPKNRPGVFSKTIAVSTNDPDQPILTLVINGDVEGRPRTIADDYPNAIGNLRTNKGQISFQNIANTEVKTDTLMVLNMGAKPMTISTASLPAHLKVSITPETLNAGQIGTIVISYNAIVKNEFGQVYDQVTLLTDDSLQGQKTIQVTANITEDFSKYSPEQLANAPKILFDTPTYDFGTVMEGTTVTYDYVFTNTGKNDLYIRKVKGG